jgi:hypothetical protein
LLFCGLPVGSQLTIDDVAEDEAFGFKQPDKAGSVGFEFVALEKNQ